ncbi:hypothetical protein G1H11_13695 [Phytoactinopolyspora alkaliphila]|uniref:G domain-containing protein n=1 Tax=Phytoactinopolyspora alkaliphila TaxID=1783498 RepID=A0A6N9YNE7_9ACTN|nr:GTPase [Phytoactinopolyspora alkaliphila]NED96359.1 hypothetical protein [Phytoactinopolyspora alkaliphila]
MTTRLAALASALDAGAGRFFDPSTAEAREVLDRAGSRLELSMAHTVVALAGSTGSGKSSLFNRISELDIARVGVRRPTTTLPLACVWGGEGAEPLLDWLEVTPGNRVTRESALEPRTEDELAGLILLDLPDHDSTEVSHRHTVDRMVALVDLFVWVLDPQKYADAVVHERYLRPLATHSDVTMVVLNQIDQLAPDDVAACVGDLRRLLDDDGLHQAPILTASATTGEGLAEIVDVLRQTVARHRAGVDRIEADARRAARKMAAAAGPGRPGGLGPAERASLTEALCEAAHIDARAEAAGAAHLCRGRRRSLPEPAQVDRAACAAAVRNVGSAAAGTLTGGWGGSVRAVADEAAGRSPDVLEKKVREVDLDGGRGGRWWRAGGVVEWLALLTGIVGGLWAVALELEERFEPGWLERLGLVQPEVLGSPVPMVLFVVGAAVGLVAAAIRVPMARRARRRHAAEVREVLRGVVADVAGDEVLAPLEAELRVYDVFRRGLEHAAR